MAYYNGRGAVLRDKMKQCNKLWTFLSMVFLFEI